MNKKDIDGYFDHMNQVFKEVDKTFKTMEHVLDQAYAESNKINWETHTLKWPKKIKGKWYWPGNKVYRKFVLSPGGGFYKYGNEFDVLKDAD